MNSGNDYPSQGKLLFMIVNHDRFFHDRGSSRDTKIENQLFIGRSDVKDRLDFKRSSLTTNQSESSISTANQDACYAAC